MKSLPKPPIAPVMPERTSLKRVYHSIGLPSTLQDALDLLPKDVKPVDVTLEEEGSYDEYCQFYQYHTTRSETMTDAQWVKALQRHDKAMQAHTLKVAAYEQAIKDHELEQQGIEAQEKALLATLQAKYPV